MTRRHSGGGRQSLFTQQQELAIVEMVRANNAIRLHQLWEQILADRQVFININRVGITMIRCILVKHKITLKQLYKFPFERNCIRVKGLQQEYVQVSVAVLYIYNTVFMYSITLIAEYVPLYQYHIETCREGHRYLYVCVLGWGCVGGSVCVVL